MATYTDIINNEATGSQAYISITIASGASLSGSIDLGKYKLAGIIMPAAWTTANITLQASIDDSAFVNVYDSSGEYSITASTSRHIMIPLSESQSFTRFIKVRSGTTGTPVNQVAERALTLLLVV